MNLLPTVVLLFASIAYFDLSYVYADTVKVPINQPAQRETVLQSGNEIVARLGAKVESDSGLPDPFVGKVEPVAQQSETNPVPVVRNTINETEQLKNLASQISARGTVMLGSVRFLLVNQRRYKIGDKIPVKYQGDDFEVELTEITNTTFTVGKGELSHTRPVLLAK